MSHKRTTEHLISSAAEDSSDSDYNPEVKKQKTRTIGRKQKKAWVPTEKATIVLLAINDSEATSKSSDSLKHIDQGALSRIKKALALGSHEHTGEEEAKQAMRIAFRLMAQLNVNQADILASEKESETLKRAGQSCVEIRSTKHKTLRYYDWMNYISWAVETLFDCRYYTTTYKDRRVWTFYGLCESTVAAAYGFEMVFNLIMEWSETKKWKLIYRAGIGAGLYKFAKHEREEEMRKVQSKELAMLEKAKFEEEEADRKRLARLENRPEKETEKQTAASQKKSILAEDIPDEEGPNPNPPSTFTLYNYGPVVRDNSDSEETGNEYESLEEGPDADFQVNNENEVIDVDAIDQILQDIEVKKSANEEVKKEDDSVEIPSASQTTYDQSKEKEQEVAPDEPEEQTPWSSKQQLVLFRENASKVAKDWLQEQNIKFKRRRRTQKPKLSTKEKKAVYNQGVEDAKKIDLKRKKIKEFGEE